MTNPFVEEQNKKRRPRLVSVSTTIDVESDSEIQKHASDFGISKAAAIRAVLKNGLQAMRAYTDTIHKRQTHP